MRAGQVEAFGVQSGTPAAIAQQVGTNQKANLQEESGCSCSWSTFIINLNPASQKSLGGVIKVVPLEKELEVPKIFQRGALLMGPLATFRL